MTKVKAKLQTICKKLSENWLERLRTPALLDAAVKAFDNLGEDGMENQGEPENLLDNLVKQLSPSAQGKFSVESCLTGYKVFNTFARRQYSLARSKQLAVPKLESIYSKF